jgi:acyl-ACP thioesterase
MEQVTLSTWPEAPGRLRTERDYLLEGDGAVLAAGKTEWAVLDQNTGRLVPAARVYPPDLAFYAGAVWEEPYSRLPDEAMEEYARYTVRSTDTDVGQHMNNVAYVRALAGTFTGEEWKKLDPREVEIAYRTPCHEGDILIWQRKTGEDGSLALRAALGDGTTAVLARIK